MGSFSGEGGKLSCVGVAAKAVLLSEFDSLNSAVSIGFAASEISGESSLEEVSEDGDNASSFLASAASSFFFGVSGLNLLNTSIRRKTLGVEKA